jgi:hypothetical protein
MSAVVPEFRKPVMTLVQALWEDQRGVLQTFPARMEDKSSGGARIRVKTPIEVGSKLRIHWRFEQFSGTARYCRSEGNDYLIGIQRDAEYSPIPNRPLSPDVPPHEVVPSNDLSGSSAKIESPPMRQESKPIEIPPAEPRVEGVLVVPVASSTTQPPPGISAEIDNRERIHIARPRDSDPLRRSELRTKRSQKDAGKERKSMHRNWLDLAAWRNRQHDSSVSAVVSGEAHGEGNGSGKTDKENPMTHITQPSEKAAGPSAREVPDFPVELLPMEDIYRAAGIMNPRKGYSINKVVEMLRSVHIRQLPKETQRAAVLMALDAAGVTVDQMQQDAKLRQDALDSHESAQRTLVETEWARKAEEITQIQAELESIKAHYTARISRNLEGVVREKATFSSWITLKQQECQSIADALDLCLKAPVTETATAAVSEVGMARAASAGAADVGATRESRSDGIH